MWFLVVSMCFTVGDAPACVSDLYPAAMRSYSDCEDAAVVRHDAIRAAALADGREILSLNTMCFTTASVRATGGGSE